MFKQQIKQKYQLRVFMKTLVFILMLLAVSNLLYADEGDVIWNNIYEFTDFDAASASRCVKETPDGGYVFCGDIFYYENSIEHMETFLAKVDDLGDTVWTRNYYWGDEFGNYANSLVLTDDGGYAIAGTRWNYRGVTCWRFRWITRAANSCNS